jgi:hypothetical protein
MAGKVVPIKSDQMALLDDLQFEVENRFSMVRRFYKVMASGVADGELSRDEYDSITQNFENGNRQWLQMLFANYSVNFFGDEDYPF